MDPFIWLLHQSWFAISPSPWSLAFYVIMSVIGARRMAGSTVQHSVKQWILLFIDALFLLGMIVFIQDTIWLLINTFRWIIPMYSGTATFWNYYVRFPQNLLGLALLTLLSYGKFRSGVAYFNWKTLSYFIIIACFTSSVFWLAPNQGWTDWTFAVSHNFPDQVILESFLISHVGYKLLIALAFLSLFPHRGLFHKDLKGRKQIEHNLEEW